MANDPNTKPLTAGGLGWNGPYDSGNVSFDSGMRRIDRLRKLGGNLINSTNDKMNEYDNVFQNEGGNYKSISVYNRPGTQERF